MKEVIHQWEQAAERFAEDQERSEYARVNREVVRQRFPREGRILNLR